MELIAVGGLLCLVRGRLLFEDVSDGEALSSEYDESRLLQFDPVADEGGLTSTEANAGLLTWCRAP